MSVTSDISAASSVSFKEHKFITTILKYAEENTDNINFRYSITDKNNIVQIRTSKPTHKLILDTNHFVYFSLFHTKDWIYIYIPENIPTNNVEPYKYNTYKTGKQRYYKGNHISISYNNQCDMFLFHYTEYDNDYNKLPQKICNFKIESVTSENLNCVFCDERGETYKSGIFVNVDEEDYEKQKHIFDIVYKIITKLRMKKQFSKNNAKIRLRKEEKEIARKIVEEKEKIRQESIHKENMRRENKKLIKENKKKSVLDDLDPNLLAFLLDEPSSNKPKNPKKNSNTSNAKKK